MKGGSLGMQARSTVPFRHGARAMCSTLPARRSDRSRFALAAKRMYRLCSNASRVLHRVFVGRFCTRYRIYPSDRHGCAVSEAAVDGTRGWTAFGHLERPKVRLISPLSTRTSEANHRGSRSHRYGRKEAAQTLRLPGRQYAAKRARAYTLIVIPHFAHRTRNTTREW